ncbi:Ion channel [Methanobrevibacter smithii DSM 2374]|jgi:voltage-gated potassium channel|uniref:Ion channel n=3 Tax=Methanobrevibacter smithii TaxID=2173 RepID=D2ZRA1_METSM|nr:ion channel [Methanobrevibacter smithii]EEE42828.1 Ion channel [Methanobrevibacter smithii DSM 2375]EFC93798.1 Ion channel [Methanobrevibacter smithii DSM 2374]
MQIFGKEINIRYFLYTRGLPALIIVDLFLITISLIFEIPNDVMLNIQQFDLIVCIILLGEYFLNLFLSGSKKLYIFDKENIIGLIASIPFDYILPLILPVALPVVFLRYLRIFKLIRVVKLAQFDIIKDLFRKTGLHKVLIGIFITILIFWAAFFLFSPSYGWVDDFYFVIVTLTTVGYGDVTPKTYNEKVLAIILILIGVFVFSAITALMSSFLTDRILDDDEEDRVSEIQETIEEKSENIMAEIKSVRMENKQLKDEANELKAEIKELKDMINKK